MAILGHDPPPLSEPAQRLGVPYAELVLSQARDSNGSWDEGGASTVFVSARLTLAVILTCLYMGQFSQTIKQGRPFSLSFLFWQLLLVAPKG